MAVAFYTFFFTFNVQMTVLIFTVFKINQMCVMAILGVWNKSVSYYHEDM